jgi:hypothetical protein
MFENLNKRNHDGFEEKHSNTFLTLPPPKLEVLTSKYKS